MSKANVITIHGKQIRVAPGSMQFFQHLMPAGAKVTVSKPDGTCIGLRKWDSGKVTVMKDKDGNPIDGRAVNTRW